MFLRLFQVSLVYKQVSGVDTWLVQFLNLKQHIIRPVIGMGEGR